MMGLCAWWSEICRCRIQVGCQGQRADVFGGGARLQRLTTSHGEMHKVPCWQGGRAIRVFKTKCEKDTA